MEAGEDMVAMVLMEDGGSSINRSNFFSSRSFKITWKKGHVENGDHVSTDKSEIANRADRVKRVGGRGGGLG